MKSWLVRFVLVFAVALVALGGSGLAQEDALEEGESTAADEQVQDGIWTLESRTLSPPKGRAIL
jgi:hypothetical protein